MSLFVIIRFSKCSNSGILKSKLPFCTSVSTSKSPTWKLRLLRPVIKIRNVALDPFAWLLLVIPASTFSLGVWQIKRKTWKEKLIADLQTKPNSDPVSLPERLEDIDKLEYKPVHVRGTFLHDKEMYLGPRSLIIQGAASTGSSFISTQGRSGYWVITPFKLADRDETILINRGWVPAKHKNPKKRQKGQVEGIVDLVGLVRTHENRPDFTPKNQEGNLYFHRDLQRMSASAGTLPIFLDAINKFDVPGGPIGGQTRISLRNEHMSYILTSFAFCGATGFMWYKKFLK